MKLVVLAVSLLAVLPALAQQVPGAATSRMPDTRGTAAQVPFGARTPLQAPRLDNGSVLHPDTQTRNLLDTHAAVLKKLSARIDELEQRLKEVEARTGKKETR
jgi:hypothetical protein